MRCLILGLAATLLATPVWADAMPNMIPAHDVSGTYLITGKNEPQTLTVEYSKSAGILRVNPAAQGGGYILYDFAAKDAKMVMPQMQRYMDESAMANAVAAHAQGGGGNGDAVSITKSGTETIAGHECTDYLATDSTKGTSSTICVTADGVILSLLSSDGNKIVAQTLSYAPVPAADVQLPPGYTKFEMPQMPAGMPSGMNGMAPGAMGGMSGMNGMQMPGNGQ